MFPRVGDGISPDVVETIPGIHDHRNFTTTIPRDFKDEKKNRMQFDIYWPLL